ncbi:hypothetical protein A2686_04655 [Candidatus Woesebacteria bacterium RIFCSPHIGHO2_01_FULL_38_10]|nr:MAG: hypothetical protein A2686_04655 [Candidatus Woesebacteria bacterium RIFCSPHIGHO2_01_FULL_38_10]
METRENGIGIEEEKNGTLQVLKDLGYTRDGGDDRTRWLYKVALGSTTSLAAKIGLTENQINEAVERGRGERQEEDDRYYSWPT